MDTIQIDGAQGEGGGQVFRTSLTLAMLTQTPVEIINIRAKRRKPGLLRQHLTCLKASQAICNATVEGDELGSARVLFAPKQIKAGKYQFAIGTAGSTSLVCQTILLPLAMADGQSYVTLEGGTHNDLAPSVTFLQKSYLRILALMGLKTDVNLDRYGFNPAGSGRWHLTIYPVSQLTPFELPNNAIGSEARAKVASVTAVVSKLPESIAQRELNTFSKILEVKESLQNLVIVDSAGPGNILIAELDHGTHCSVFERVGAFGTSAETVAKRTAGKLRKFVHSGAQIEEHLADQLLLPMVLAKAGSFITTQPSMHTLTNIQVIRQLCGVNIDVQTLDEKRWKITIVE